MAKEQITELEKGIKERETLRPQRIANYRIKFANGPPRCRQRDCANTEQLVVVRVGGKVQPVLSVRCRVHVGKLPVMPGQWPDGGKRS